MKMRLGLITLILLFLLPQAMMAQEKKRLHQDDYTGWKTLGGIEISPDGNWVVYQVNPQQYGDGELIIRHIPSGRQHVVPRGYRSSISPGGGFVVFNIGPEFAVERQAKMDGVRRNELPTDSIGFFVFGTETLEKLPGIESFQMPDDESDWLAYLINNANIRAPKKEDNGEEAEENEENGEEQEKPLRNKQLFVYNPLSGNRHMIDDVEQYVFTGDGSLVAALTKKEENDSLTINQVVAFDVRRQEMKVVNSGEGEYKQMSVARDGSHLAWMHSGDTIDEKLYDIHLWENRRDRVSKVVDYQTAGMPEGFSPSDNQRPSFSRDGRRLFFGTAPKPEPEPEETLLSEEKYSVDIWHWQDPALQPRQKISAARDRRATQQAVYLVGQNKMVQIGDEIISTVSFGRDNELDLGLGSDGSPYEIASQWTGGGTRDIYLVNINDGSRRLILEGASSTVTMSPDGKYILWWDTVSLNWMSYSIDRGETLNLTADFQVPLFNETHDSPSDPRPHGVAGWTENDERVVVYDRFDLWVLDPRGRVAAENLTQSYGRGNDIRFRIQSLDREERFLDLRGPIVLNAFDNTTMQSGFYQLERGRLSNLIMGDYLYSGLMKATDADRFLWRRSTFQEYPDLWIGASDFSGASKISNANPQQDDYYWGTVKLVEWNSFNHNEPLKGLLYLPENFDESKQYPMIVYFYELQSQTKHQHYVPSPSRSTINRSYCVSNDYIVFVPDITYREGFPGESGYDAIVSGTHAMTERYPFINRDRIGLQGQSWGGYQIAFLVTRTNLYAAAMAGAPVSNMVSAYGGIRWQTGLNRQFQYEQTQSRIGGTLWERPLRYIENSPIFFADKVETPLLMMHNDDDGAVPWEQGIEFFTALRRLSKPVWMLVYNEEAHNLTRWPNRVDLDIRMYQFFDHYLKDLSAPVWMKEGLPAVDKGRRDAYELVE